MNIRSTATSWYQKHYGKRPKYFCSSKYYEAHESWSKTPVWWFQVSLQWLDEKLESHVIFVGEKRSDLDDFYVLKVPLIYFFKHLNEFASLGDKINLMLSAENHNKFNDVRGKGHVEFTQFLVKEK
jgi:hypothetical protein